MTFRPAREISIEVRQRAVRDPANYDPGPPSPALPAQPSRWPLRASVAAFTALAGGLSFLAFQLPSPWQWPAAVVACAGVWALWQLTGLGTRLARRGHRGRHRRPRRAPISDIDRLRAMLDADVDGSDERRHPDRTMASRP